MPVWRPNTASNDLMSNTTDHRLSVLKAARKEVVDHARKYEICVTSLENMSFLPSINEQQKGHAWPVSGSSCEDSSVRSRIKSSSSGVTGPETAALRSSDEACSFPEPLFVDDTLPPVPERSSRRVKLHLPVREAAMMGSFPPQFSACDDGEPYVMTPSVYGNWLALHRELEEKFDIGDLSITGGLGMQASEEGRDTLKPEPLNLGDCRQRRWGRSG